MEITDFGMRTNVFFSAWDLAQSMQQPFSILFDLIKFDTIFFPLCESAIVAIIEEKR